MLEYDTTKTLAGLPAPSGWYVVSRQGDYGLAWRSTIGEPLTVIESTCPRSDGQTWLHVSLSRRNERMPTYEHIQLLRRLFIGEEREAYMIFPPKERYVNIHPGVVHLYCCLDKPLGVLPHMEGEIGGIKSI